MDVLIVLQSNGLSLTKIEIESLTGFKELKHIHCQTDNDPNRSKDFIVITVDIALADMEDIFLSLVAHKYAIAFDGNVPGFSIFSKL